MRKLISRSLAGFTLFFATPASANPTGSMYAAWFPGDENIIVDKKGVAWQECIGRGCVHEYTKVTGAITKLGVFRANSGYYYCKYPTATTKNHSSGKCTSKGWKF